MGLDVYLHTKAHQEARAAYEKAWEEIYDSGRWESMSEDEKKAWRAAHPYPSGEDLPSSTYPDHLFNRRYLRSSYNGFNSAVPDMLGNDHSLYWIFEPVRSGLDDEYDIELTSASIGALDEAKKRALQVAGELRECDPLRVEAVSAIVGGRDHLWQEPPTQDQVLQWYKEEKAERADKPSPFGEDSGYSSAKGTVLGFKKGLEVLAVTSGRDILGSPAAIIVYRNTEALESYVQSAEITAEFCDEAISLIERDGSVSMIWSG